MTNVPLVLPIQIAMNDLDTDAQAEMLVIQNHLENIQSKIGEDGFFTSCDLALGSGIARGCIPAYMIRAMANSSDPEVPEEFVEPKSISEIVSGYAVLMYRVGYEHGRTHNTAQKGVQQ